MKKLWIAMPAVFVLSLTTVVNLVTQGARGPAATPCSSLGGPVSYSVIKRAIRDCRIDSADELLSLLPSDYRSYYTLVHQSRSVQRESADHSSPRVILFGVDARTILAFTGDPRHPDYHKLEVMDFDETRQRYDLHEILFASASGSQASDSMLEPAWPNDSKTVRFNENPPTCLKCHSSDTRAIWESYDTWRGVYGSGNDNLVTQEEARRYSAFQRLAPDHPRYRALNPRPGLSTSPYNDLGVSKADERAGRRLYRPNTRLTKLLSMNAYKTLWQRVRANPAYLAVRPFFLLNQLECQETRSWTQRFSPLFKRQVSQALDPYPLAKARYIEYINEHSADKEERLNQPVILHPDSHFVLSAILYALGLDQADLSLTFERDDGYGVGFWDGFNTIGDWVKNGMVMDAYLSDKTLAPIFAARVIKGYLANDPVRAINVEIDYKRMAEKNCALISRRFLAALASPPKPPSRAEAAYHRPAPPKPLVRNCLGCHLNGVAPRIDFSEPEGLSRATLARSRDLVESGKMPTDHRMTDSERGRVLKQIDSLLAD